MHALAFTTFFLYTILMQIFLFWTLWFLLAEGILFACSFFLRKKQCKSFVYLLLGIGKILLGIGCGVIVLAGPLFFRPVQPLLTAFYVALFTDGIADMVFFVLPKRKISKKLLLRKGIGLLLGFSFFVYGTINMQIVQPRYISVKSDKLEHNYTFIFVSDVHVGSPQSEKTVTEYVQKMLAEESDFIVLGGDITDDYTTKEQMISFFALFKDVNKPVYYIYGNHDRQNHADSANGRQYSVEELHDTLLSNGIIILQDDFVRFADDLVLLGREDKSETQRKSETDLLYPDEDVFLLTFDHQPDFYKKSDLQVSGHTHAGQFFPLCFFDDLFIGDTYGLYEKEEKLLYVSSGSAGWRIPFRSDKHCEYVVITLSVN